MIWILYLFNRTQGRCGSSAAWMSLFPLWVLLGSYLCSGTCWRRMRRWARILNLEDMPPLSFAQRKRDYRVNLNSPQLCKADIYIYIYIFIHTENIYIEKFCLTSEKVLSDARLGAKLRVTENRYVLFNSLTYVYLALLPRHWALYANVDSTPTFIYILMYMYIL